MQVSFIGRAQRDEPTCSSQNTIVENFRTYFSIRLTKTLRQMWTSQSLRCFVFYNRRR
jgi:hypothetical protein